MLSKISVIERAKTAVHPPDATNLRSTLKNTPTEFFRTPSL